MFPFNCYQNEIYICSGIKLHIKFQIKKKIQLKLIKTENKNIENE